MKITLAWSSSNKEGASIYCLNISWHLCDLFLQGQVCKVVMLNSYRNPREPDRYANKLRHERVVFEGIYMANCANQGEIMLCMVEEKLFNTKTVSGRTFKSANSCNSNRVPRRHSASTQTTRLSSDSRLSHMWPSRARTLRRQVWQMSKKCSWFRNLSPGKWRQQMIVLLDLQIRP